MSIIENHIEIKTPTENITLWRYMDIPSFIQLLAKESLIFVKADLFEDKYEGTLPKLTINMIETSPNSKLKGFKGEIFGETYENFSDYLKSHRKRTFLNCWCKENFEMIHMWKIYSKENGVAIQTTYENLKKAIISKENIFSTEIDYVDFDNDLIDWKSTMKYFTIKRKEYKSESEFRLLIQHPRIIEDKLPPLIQEYKEHSHEREELYCKTQIIHCEVDINILISKIHLSPYAPKWYKELINDILIKYNLRNIEIIQTDL